MSGSAPFCGPNTFARVLEGGAHVAQHDDLRAAQAAARPRSPRARPRRRRWSPSRRRRRGSPARPPRRRRRSARRCRRWTPPRRRARPRRPAPSPLAAAISTIAVPPSSTQPEPGADRAPERVLRPRRRRSSPPSWGSSASSVPSPPSATGHRSGGISPARSSPRPIAPATCGAENVPLKESGATSTGRSGAMRGSCQTHPVTQDRCTYTIAAA